MENKLFTIGEMARIEGLTIKAIRFYERIGLILPAFVDPATRYRYYSIEQFILFDMVKAGRSIGMSPKDIKAMLERKDEAALDESLASEEKQALSRIEELRGSVAAMRAIRSALEASRSAASQGGLFFKNIPERRIVAKAIAPDAEAADILMEYSVLERLVRDKGLVDAYETGIIFGSDENANFRPSFAFTVVAKASPSRISKPKVPSTIPAGRFLCVAYGETDALAQQRKLFSYLRRKKMKPSILLQVDLLSGFFSPASGKVLMQALV
jgi:MerR family transcriptional regulator, activator of bmr gene